MAGPPRRVLQRKAKATNSNGDMGYLPSGTSLQQSSWTNDHGSSSSLTDRLVSALTPALSTADTQDLEADRDDNTTVTNNWDTKWDDPEGPIPEVLLRIKVHPTVEERKDARAALTQVIRWAECNPRQLAAWTAKGLIIKKDIVPRLEWLPPQKVGTTRTPEQIVANEFQSRIQRWRVPNGVLPVIKTATRRPKSSTKDSEAEVAVSQKKVWKMWSQLTDQQLLHGVIGEVDDTNFKVHTPQDKYHKNLKSNVSATYDLPNASELSETDAEGLKSLGRQPPNLRRYYESRPHIWKRDQPEEFRKAMKLKELDTAAIMSSNQHRPVIARKQLNTVAELKNAMDPVPSLKPTALAQEQHITKAKADHVVEWASPFISPALPLLGSNEQSKSEYELSKDSTFRTESGMAEKNKPFTAPFEKKRKLDTGLSGYQLDPFEDYIDGKHKSAAKVIADGTHSRVRKGKHHRAINNSTSSSQFGGDPAEELHQSNLSAHQQDRVGWPHFGNHDPHQQAPKVDSSNLSYSIMSMNEINSFAAFDAGYHHPSQVLTTAPPVGVTMMEGGAMAESSRDHFAGLFSLSAYDWFQHSSQKQIHNTGYPQEFSKSSVDQHFRKKARKSSPHALAPASSASGQGPEHLSIYSTSVPDWMIDPALTTEQDVPRFNE